MGKTASRAVGREKTIKSMMNLTIIKKKRKELTLLQLMFGFFLTGLALHFVLSFVGPLF
jgi:hypothetical protein